MWHIDHTVFNSDDALFTLCVAFYTTITILPIFLPANPHYHPLASFAWQFCAYLFFKIRSLIKKDAHNVDLHHPWRLLNRLETKAEDIDSKQIPDSDARILESLFD